MRSSSHQVRYQKIFASASGREQEYSHEVEARNICISVRKKAGIFP
jgi:hypothetical protein